MNKDLMTNIEDYNKSCEQALESLKSLLKNGVNTKELMFAIKITHEIVTDCFEMNMKYGEDNKEGEENE